MHPIVIVALIFVAIGCAYFMLTNLESAQMAASGAANNAITTYGAIALKVLIAVIILYGIYYVVEVVRTALMQRKALQRLRKDNDTV